MMTSREPVHAVIPAASLEAGAVPAAPDDAVGVGVAAGVLPDPDQERGEVADWPWLTLELCVFGVVVGVQVPAIIKAKYPILRAIEALAILVPLYLLIFARIYLSNSIGDPAAFNQPLDKTTALYFTVTVFATVGFGDIVAQSQQHEAAGHAPDAAQPGAAGTGDQTADRVGAAGRRPAARAGRPRRKGPTGRLSAGSRGRPNRVRWIHLPTRLWGMTPHPPWQHAVDMSSMPAPVRRRLTHATARTTSVPARSLAHSTRKRGDTPWTR